MANFIEIDLGGFQQLAGQFKAAPEIALQELQKAMAEADMLLKRLVQDALPTATGTLRASVFGVERATETGVIGLVGSPLIYAPPVELGTRPHFPPIEPLVDWVKLKLGVPEKDARGVAFLVARKIARKGTGATHVFKLSFERGEQQVRDMFARALGRIAQRIIERR